MLAPYFLHLFSDVTLYRMLKNGNIREIDSTVLHSIRPAFYTYPREMVSEKKVPVQNSLLHE